MLIEEAFKQGQEFRKLLLEKGGNTESTIHKLQNARFNHDDVCYEYLTLCVDLGRSSKDFILDLLRGSLTSESVAMSLALGLTSE